MSCTGRGRVAKSGNGLSKQSHQRSQAEVSRLSKGRRAPDQKTYGKTPVAIGDSLRAWDESRRLTDFLRFKVRSGDPAATDSNRRISIISRQERQALKHEIQCVDVSMFALEFERTSKRDSNEYLEVMRQSRDEREQFLRNHCFLLRCFLVVSQEGEEADCLAT
jgi:hypothetical protein